MIFFQAEEKYSRFYVPLVDFSSNHLYFPNKVNCFVINDYLDGMTVFYRCCALDTVENLDPIIKSPLETKLGDALYE